MHLKDVKIVHTFNITGRGKALVTDLDFDKEAHRFFKGDTLRVEDKIYEIISVEAILQVGGKEFVAFIAKEISNKELFMKLVSKDKSTWMEEAKWRQRNWWWLTPWKRIQVKWYCNIKPFFQKYMN